MVSKKIAEERQKRFEEFLLVNGFADDLERLAKELGKKGATGLYHYKNGTRPIQDKFAIQLYNMYKVSPDWLLKGIGEMFTTNPKDNSIHGSQSALLKDTPNEGHEQMSDTGKSDSKQSSDSGADAVNDKAEGVAMTVNLMKEVHEIKGQLDMLKKIIFELSLRINNLANQELDSLILKPQSEAIKKTSEK